MEPVFETYALNGDGKQLYGMIGFPSVVPGQAITLALRSSYNKSLANEVAIGSAPFICANGCFSGEFMIKAKHTTHVFETLARMLAEITDSAVVPVVERMREVQGWRDIPVHDDLFAELQSQGARVQRLSVVRWTRAPWSVSIALYSTEPTNQPRKRHHENQHTLSTLQVCKRQEP